MGLPKTLATSWPRSMHRSKTSCNLKASTVLAQPLYLGSRFAWRACKNVLAVNHLDILSNCCSGKLGLKTLGIASEHTAPRGVITLQLLFSCPSATERVLRSLPKLGWSLHASINLKPLFGRTLQQSFHGSSVAHIIAFFQVLFR